MARKLLTVLILIAGLFLITSISATAQKPAQEIPEQEGIYDVSEKPGLKVRVFVYKYKGKPEGVGKPDKNQEAIVCDLQDPDTTTVVGATGWKLPYDWTYNLNPSSVPSSVGSGNLPKIALDSFSAWSTPSGVTFKKGEDTTATKYGLDGINLISWGRSGSNALAVTYTWYYPSTGSVVEIDTIMNSKYKWSWSDYSTGCADSEKYDAQNILTHELGHWMGLNDHYSNDYVDATMYGYGSTGEIKKDTLTIGDISGINLIYNN